MKKTVLAVLMLGVLGLTTACGTTEARPQPGPAPDPPAAGAPTTPAPQPEMLMGEAHVSPDIAAWAEKLKLEAGAFRTTVGDWDGYVVAMGEKRSGGYAVELAEAGFSGGKEWIVQVRYRSPEPGAITTMALTYPRLVFAVPKGTPVKIQVVTEAGKPEALTIHEK